MCSVPSGTRILPSVPSSIASTSMVALSVSISAITSPARTASPSWTCHLASVPSSMVGDSAGMRISVGITRKGSRCHHVGVKLGRVRLGIVLRELGRLVDQAAEVAVDVLQLVLAAPRLQELIAHEFDRVVMLAHVHDLIAGAVFGRVRHGMAAIAVGLKLEDHRPL